MSRFFVSTPLDFEKTVQQEIKDVWPFLLGKDAKKHVLPIPNLDVLEGGVEFEADLFTGLQLNFFLKTANRILLRMTSFKARDLPKFYQKFKSLPWKEYLPHGEVEWEVAAQKSRLNNEKRLQESASKALSELFGNQPGKAPCATIYIRMDDDLCTISLDTTGEHLHKRGWSILKGEAPLRETLAAFMLKKMMEGVSLEELQQVTLLDPMMGSGTFLTEARSLGEGQFVRSYAFQKWVRAPKLFLSPSFALNYEKPSAPLLKRYVGFDIAQEMIPVAEKNFLEVEKQIEFVRRKSFKKADVLFQQQDALTGSYICEGPLWMILNPPYGERLPVAGQGGLNGLVRTLCEKYKPSKLGVLYPDKESVEVAPYGYLVDKETPINNGGLRCHFSVLVKR